MAELQLSAGHIFMPQWVEQQAACPHWTPSNRGVNDMRHDRKILLSPVESCLDLRTKRYFTSSVHNIIEAQINQPATIPTLRVRQRHRVYMSRQLCRHNATAYPQQIILGNLNWSAAVVRKHHEMIDHATQHHLSVVTRHQKAAIPAHDHDPGRIVMGTSNRSMILPMLCRRWDKCSTDVYVCLTSQARVLYTKRKLSNQRSRFKREKQQPSDTYLWYTSEKNESLRSSLEEPRTYAFQLNFFDSNTKKFRGRLYDITFRQVTIGVACLRIHSIEFFGIWCKYIQREGGRTISLFVFTWGELLVTA